MRTEFETKRLRVGDPVIVIAGGNKKKKPIKGQTGKIKSFVGPARSRVVIEGLNYITKNIRAKRPGEENRQLREEGSMHISNVMYYVESLSKAVRLKVESLADGTKVRGYTDPEKKQFVQLES
jgi:large subunit ribosomal protein L24